MSLQIFLEAVQSDCISHTVRKIVPEFWSNKGEGSVFKLILVPRYWFTQQHLATALLVMIRLRFSLEQLLDVLWSLIINCFPSSCHQFKLNSCRDRQPVKLFSVLTHSVMLFQFFNKSNCNYDQISYDFLKLCSWPEGFWSSNVL